jgi:hypothetical protein
MGHPQIVLQKFVPLPPIKFLLAQKNWVIAGNFQPASTRGVTFVETLTA